METSFVVDSNFFIQAHRSHYPFDVFPSFWGKVKELASSGRIVCIDKVKNELYKNNDELKAWCESNFATSFFKDSSECIEHYGKIMQWAMSKSDHYVKRALDEFMDADEADAWLIAYAINSGIYIVTHEISAPDRKNKIKIPDACVPFGITYINTVEMFRMLGEKF